MSAVIKSPSEASPGATPQPLATGDAHRLIAFRRGEAVTLGTFLGHVRGVAALLPAGRHVINLCDDRYRFLVAFCAVASRGQTTLLPPSRAPVAIDAVQHQYADTYCIGDGEFAAAPPRYLRLPARLPSLDGPLPQVADDALVAIGFTSGSTGAPSANPKTWASFRASTGQNLAVLHDLWPRDAPQVVATVPPQHMYGMELSVLLPLIGGAAVHVERPFFPADVAAALHDASGARLLVTTPVHLRALLASHVQLPPLAGIVTATAPLPQPLAVLAEERYGCELREMFGSTETCMIARRRTAIEERWTPLPGVRLQSQPDGTLVHAAHLPHPVALADLFDIDGDGRFRLCGRQADLLEIAGKRASLADLTRCLLAIPGVEDGVVTQLDEADGNGIRRIAALVVAPTLDRAGITAALRHSVDPVFLPRPLRIVDTLPRNDTGKLPRAALLRLLQGDMQ